MRKSCEVLKLLTNAHRQVYNAALIKIENKTITHQVLSHPFSVNPHPFRGNQLFFLLPIMHKMSFHGGSHGKESACYARGPCLISGLGRFPGERKDNPLQYSCLRNPMNRGVWWATVHGVAKSQIQLSTWYTPIPVFLPGEFLGQKGLGDHSPWSCKELNTIKGLTHA